MNEMSTKNYINHEIIPEQSRRNFAMFAPKLPKRKGFFRRVSSLDRRYSVIFNIENVFLKLRILKAVDH